MGHGDHDFRLVAQEIENHTGILSRAALDRLRGVVKGLCRAPRNLAPTATFSNKKRLRGLRFC